MKLWNSLTIKQKIWGLVAIPTLVILLLASHQIININQQVGQLNRADNMARQLDSLARLNTYSHLLRADNQKRDNSEPPNAVAAITQQLNDLLTFDQEFAAIHPLLEQYRETVAAIVDSEDSASRIDNIVWHVEVYKELLLSVEERTLVAMPASVSNHLKALLQLNWLLFWSAEEAWQIQQLTSLTSTSSFTAPELQAEIKALIQQQTLFMERFVVINAEPDQIKLMLSTFSNPAFAASQQFRELVLADTANEISPAQLAQGQQVLATRLALFQEVAGVISAQLLQEVEQHLADFQQQRLLVIIVITLLVVGVLWAGIHLGHRIIHNLTLVLDYLADEGKTTTQLSQQIDGRDELASFAREVERLSAERNESQQRLIVAKNEAISAREEAEIASRAKSSFLANMSHEIRTPLNGVIGMSEVLATTQLSAIQKDYLDTIETSSHLLLALINDILDFSKIESGKLSVSLHSTALRETVYDLAAIVAPKISEKPIALLLNIDERIPARVMADDHRIRQVLMNLMSNAVKFTHQGTITVTVAYQGERDGKSLINFSVADSGIGIDEQQQQHIFEPFAQEDASITRKFQGTGLGLAISRQLVDLMGGEIGLVSDKGRGSRFYFTLTLATAEHEFHSANLPTLADIVLYGQVQKVNQDIVESLAYMGVPIKHQANAFEQIPLSNNQQQLIVLYVVGPDQTEAQVRDEINRIARSHLAICLVRQLNKNEFNCGEQVTAMLTYPMLGNRLLKALEACQQYVETGVVSRVKATTSVSRGLILLVEDNPVNQKVLSLQLASAGFQFDIADDGEQAMMLFSKGKRYDVVLMDCMMPVKDGFSTTREIRLYEQDNECIPTPIIALTASVLEEDVERCYDAGMNDFVPKPFKRDILFERINHAMLQTKRKSGSPADQASIQLKTDARNGINVLLVEDNPINQKVASLLLEKAGYGYQVANNGEEAVDLYRKSPSFDVILMDLMMPVKDGFAASVEVRQFEQQQGLEATPIIALTASVIDDDIQRCFDSGMNGYVPKPVKGEKLYSEIENLTIT
ncbi:response regulator [Thalassotalea euphylliae]|uniref:histidine kinase n=1 Tax=Thalassotalea euphylliae TaxID=1655234 RepID=A0A3E0TLI6_9GAMM|nr:response regulator [Thalassotalea euphylliae]REL25283.1 response regulator [Thalassotalea euphylliae]